MVTELARQYGLLTLLGLPAFAWYVRQAKRFARLTDDWLRRFRWWLRRSGRRLLHWLLIGGDE
ncbi:hypothetical protein ACIRRI_41830 [Streptomyces mirabilis]|uniref:hypothetical protein n=1 Tax=Streptomyces mirabilis TaxID=68239 RepID=UPI00381D98F3